MHFQKILDKGKISNKKLIIYFVMSEITAIFELVLEVNP